MKMLIVLKHMLKYLQIKLSDTGIGLKSLRGTVDGIQGYHVCLHGSSQPSLSPAILQCADSTQSEDREWGSLFRLVSLTLHISVLRIQFDEVLTCLYPRNSHYSMSAIPNISGSSCTSPHLSLVSLSYKGSIYFGSLAS